MREMDPMTAHKEAAWDALLHSFEINAATATTAKALFLAGWDAAMMAAADSIRESASWKETWRTTAEKLQQTLDSALAEKNALVAACKATDEAIQRLRMRGPAPGVLAKLQRAQEDVLWPAIIRAEQ